MAKTILGRSDRPPERKICSFAKNSSTGAQIGARMFIWNKKHIGTCILSLSYFEFTLATLYITQRQLRQWIHLSVPLPAASTKLNLDPQRVKVYRHYL